MGKIAHCISRQYITYTAWHSMGLYFEQIVLIVDFSFPLRLTSTLDYVELLQTDLGLDPPIVRLVPHPCDPHPFVGTRRL